MKTLSIFAICILGLVCVSAINTKWSLNHHNKGQLKFKRDIYTNGKANELEEVRSDWLIDLIEKLLKMMAEDFIKLIDRTVKDFAEWLHIEVLTKLEDIISSIPSADVQAQLRMILENFIRESAEIIAPIEEYMSKIIPELQTAEIQVIGEKNHERNLADLIEQILRISLEELLIEVNLVMVKTEELVVKSLEQLLEINVGGPAGEELNRVINGSLKEAEEIINPLLRMLDTILPDRPQGI